MKRKAVVKLACCLLIFLFASCGLFPEGTDLPLSSSADLQDHTGSGGVVPGDEVVKVTGKDPVTFTMFVGNPGQAPAPDAKIIRKIQQITGVTIEFEFLVGDLSQKSGVMIASGDYPDFIYPSQDRNKFVEAGAFTPLEDKIYTYPNLKRHYEKYDAKLRAIGNEKKIYILDAWGRQYGEAYEPGYGGPAFWIQKDVLAEAGYVRPGTLEEYFNVIEAYIARHPTIDGKSVSGFEILCDGWRSFCLKNAPQHLVGAPNDGDILVNQKTLRSEIYANKGYAKAYYAKLNEEYLKDVITPETFTQTYDQYLAKITSGRVLGMFDQGWNFADATNLLIRDGKYERTYVPLELTYEGIKPWYRDVNSVVGGNGLGISVNCRDVERALSFMDRMLDEDIQKLLTWGIEGENFQMDSDGKYFLTLEQRTLRNDPVFAVKTGIGSQLYLCFPKMQGFFSDGNGAGPQSQPEEVLASMDPYDREFLDKYHFQSFSEFMTPGPENPAYYPVWAFTIPEGTPAKLAYTKYTDTEAKFLPYVIMAKKGHFEAAWDEYIAELGMTGYKAYEAEVDRQIQERMSSK